VADWLTGIGLVLGFVGALLLFFFNVPRYPLKADAGKLGLELEQEDEAEKERVKWADFWSRCGVVLLAIGFALQFAGLVCGT
jgi:hypothetical protein